jgi:HlyD family secretion protein
VDAYPDRLFQARITKVRFGSAAMEQEKSSTNTATSAGVVTYTTSLAVDNPDLALRPGMTATAEIVVHKIADALLVPNAALRFTPPTPNNAGQSRGIIGALMPRPPMRRPSTGTADGKGRRPRVWVLSAGEPRPIPVTLGASDGVHTVITQGELQPGSQVIVDMLSVKP